MAHEAIVMKKSKPEEVHETDSSIEERIVNVDGTEIPFNFLVIDSSDKWMNAKESTGSYSMSVGGDGSQRVRIPLCGISLKDWEAAEKDNPIPQPLQGGEQHTDEAKREFDDKFNVALMGKRLAIFELTTGKKIPGESKEEKIAWLMQRSPAETEQLFDYIQNSICNLKDGHLLAQYIEASKNRGSSSGQSSDVKDFESFDDWDVASSATHYFRMHRPTEDFIVEIPLKGVSHEMRQKIDDQTINPDPPKIPARDPVTRRFDPNNIVPNYDDPAWLSRVRAVQQKRTAMIMDASLLFSIPGTNYQEKYQWLSTKLVGDVVRLKEFIEEEVMGFTGSLNFS